MSVESNTAELQLQIDDLQSRLSYQEDFLQSLNDVIANQDALIAQLQQQLQQNQQRLDAVAFSMSPKDTEKPPHY